MIEDIEDPTNLTGLHSLVNEKHVNKSLNLEVIEKQFIGKNGIKKIPEYDPDQEFTKTMGNINNYTKDYSKYDTDYDKTIKKHVEVQSEDEELEEGEEGEEPEELEEPGEEGEEPEPEDESEEPAGNYKSYEYNQPRRPPPAMQRRAPTYFSQELKRGGENNPMSGSTSRPSEDYIGGAIRDYAGDDINFEKEAEEEEKAVLLEDIDELRYELEGDGIDLSRIPIVDTTTPLHIVRKIHKMLRMKYDRKRCNGFGTELIMAGAQGLEYIFDGRRKFGPYTPDLTNWHNTIRPKLRRMRYETSTIVANIMHDYNIGPLARVFLELVPSAFLYSKMRRDQHGRSNYTPDQMSEAYEDLRQFDND